MSLSPQAIGIVVGGLIPAFVYGLSAVSQRGSIGMGIGIGVFLIGAGLAVVLTGGLFLLFVPDRAWSARSFLLAMATGCAWGVGTGLVSVALAKFGVPMGKLVPLYNMNSLIAVLLILWIFAEWQQVKSLQLLIGSVLIVIGGTLVARA
ncbi:MAG: hypothetical protein PHI23_00290 [Candidatus Peribacteraceae bacterium]|nr:hypothetical protein [Candidatus Peribacteraceae bacterium]